jgi:hypothetical protein
MLPLAAFEPMTIPTGVLPSPPGPANLLVYAHLGYNDGGDMDPTTSRELVETALRVLVAWNSWCEPSPLDTTTLKRAFPAWNHLPADELACKTFNALRDFAFPQQNGEPNTNDKVA